MKKAVVCGAGGFIGSHLVKRLKDDGYWVRGIDLKYPEYAPTAADDFIVGDLRDIKVCQNCFDQPFDEAYQLAADMGGAGYISTGDNDADIMHNSVLVNLNVLNVCSDSGVARIFYASSACVYPEYNQLDTEKPICLESSVYPAEPDSEYGWEKLFSERLYLSYGRNKNLQVRIARFHNIFGSEGTWEGGREKAPAAFCRKVAMADEGGEIEMWGDGFQTRSFLHVDECIEAVLRLMRSDWEGPVNIGSDEMISLNQLAKMIMELSGKNLTISHIPGPLGVRGRTSDNNLIKLKLDWQPMQPLYEGLRSTYQWVAAEVEKKYS